MLSFVFFPCYGFLSEDKNCRYQQYVLYLTCQLMSHESPALGSILLPLSFTSCHTPLTPLYLTLEKLVHRTISTPTLGRSAMLGPAFAILGSPLPTQKPAFRLVPSSANLIIPVVALLSPAQTLFCTQ